MQAFDVYPLLDVEISRSAGAYVWDQDGRQYLDFYGGHAVISVGHGHPHFTGAIQRQLKRSVFYSNSVRNPLRDRLADQLGRLSGYPGYQLFLVSSGAEAVENALKLASFHNGRHKVIAFERGFHGRTSAAVRVTDNDKLSAPINRGFERVLLPWNDVAAARNALAAGDVCAVIIEGIQGVGGIHLPSPELLATLRAGCDEHGSVLILDEVQSGYGRSGKFFAHQYAGVRPDLITVAKGMGNGFPVGGVLIAPTFRAAHGMLGTTFGGTQLACAAAIAVLEIIESEELITNAAIRGTELRAGLADLPGVRAVRGLGCMLGVDFNFPVKAFRRSLVHDFGLFVGSSSQLNTIRLLPSLAISTNEVANFLQRFAAGLEAYQKNMPDRAQLSI